MRDPFIFLDTFASSRHLQCKEGPFPHSFNIVLEGFPLNIFFLEEREMMLLQGIVALVPEDAQEKMALFTRLLRMNNGFSDTGGACLGLDSEQNVITFQVTWPLTGLDQPHFDTVMDNVIALAAHLVRELAMPAGSEQQPQSVVESQFADASLLRV